MIVVVARVNCIWVVVLRNVEQSYLKVKINTTEINLILHLGVIRTSELRFKKQFIGDDSFTFILFSNGPYLAANMVAAQHKAATAAAYLAVATNNIVWRETPCVGFRKQNKLFNFLLLQSHLLNAIDFEKSRYL